MGRISGENKRKSWSELNKTRKEEKRKWKEQNLVKKMEKQQQKQAEIATPKPEVVKHDLSTISIAIPGSILENAQSPELRSYLAGQIARAACIFQIDELVIFDDFSDEANCRKDTVEDSFSLKTARESCVQLARILLYLECPQYLRKHFFPIHKHLRFSGLLNPLNAPHHLGRYDTFIYREGFVENKAVKEGRGSVVNVGLLKDISVDRLLEPGLRCTVQMLPPKEGSKKLKGVVVSPQTPRSDTGVYWGYSVRIATSLSQVFSDSPYKNGYDLTVGTSDKGSPIDDFSCPAYKHLLIVFGGVPGLEAALETDNNLNVDDPKSLFNYYLNTLPDQGSRTIRTEEAILISLSGLRPKLKPENPAKMFDNSLITFCNSAPTRSVVNTANADNSVGTKKDEMSRFD